MKNFTKNMDLFAIVATVAIFASLVVLACLKANVINLM
jgi:hypothetical protein